MDPERLNTARPPPPPPPPRSLSLSNCTMTADTGRLNEVCPRGIVARAVDLRTSEHRPAINTYNYNLNYNHVGGAGIIINHNTISNSGSGSGAGADDIRRQIVNADRERMLSEQQAREIGPSARRQAHESETSGTGRLMSSAGVHAATFVAGVSVGAAAVGYTRSAQPRCLSDLSSINPLLLPRTMIWVLSRPLSTITFITRRRYSPDEVSPLPPESFWQPVRVSGGTITVALVLPCGIYHIAATSIGELLQKLSDELMAPLNPAQLRRVVGLGPAFIARLQACSTRSSGTKIRRVDLLDPDTMFAGLSQTTACDVYLFTTYPPLPFS